MTRGIRRGFCFSRAQAIHYIRIIGSMSKHSKWSKVKHQKGAADAKRAAVFTRLARAITVAAREGGGDPNFNFKLRTAIDLALAGNMPKDNIERAVKKGTGEIESERIESIVYEGYGPGGVAILVEALTDNRNRTSSSLRHAFSLHGGNLAATGAVQWMFDRKGVVRATSGDGNGLDDAKELALIEAGADDIAKEDGEIVVTTAVESLAKVRGAAEAAGLPVASAGIEWVTKDAAPAPDAETREKVEGLLDALDEDEDVNAIYSTLS